MVCPRASLHIKCETSRPGENRTLIDVRLKGVSFPISHEPIMPACSLDGRRHLIQLVIALPTTKWCSLLRHVKRWLLTIVVRRITVLLLITLWHLLLTVVTIRLLLSRNPLMLMVMVKIRLSLTSPSLSYWGSLLNSILNVNLRTSILLGRILWVLRILTHVRLKAILSRSRPAQTQTHNHTRQHLPEHTLS